MVVHICLFQKLSHYGIRDTHLLWLKSFLSNRSQYVVLDNQKSHATEVLSDVPQGTVLAPLLFLLYINNLPACVDNHIKLYADDVLLYSNINSVADSIAQ